MCGRFTLLQTWREVWTFSKPFRGPSEECAPNYNIPPKANIPVIFTDENGPIGSLMQWWLVPSWSKTSEVKYSTFNAKSEDAATKPAFRAPFRNRRCVIPASGFFEWKKLDDGSKQPYYITRADGKPMYFAGVWDRWHDELDSCAILTVSAKTQMQQLHTRMPCILEVEQLERWMDVHTTDVSAVQPMLHPAPEGVLTMKPVDPRVGNVRNNDPALIEEKTV